MSIETSNLEDIVDTFFLGYLTQEEWNKIKKELTAEEIAWIKKEVNNE
jgi:hypothetical protein